jgi:DNA-directed RNA polymerase specialized sigma24 family protein
VDLLQLARARFCKIAHLIKRGRSLPLETEDLVQQVSLRLFRIPPEARPREARHYYAFVAMQIRRELIDCLRRLMRQPRESELPAEDLAGSASGPDTLAGWAGVNIVAPLEEAFRVPVRLENDADAAAL